MYKGSIRPTNCQAMQGPHAAGTLTSDLAVCWFGMLWPLADFTSLSFPFGCTELYLAFQSSKMFHGIPLYPAPSYVRAKLLLRTCQDPGR